jgi:hypothetical protein
MKSIAARIARAANRVFRCRGPVLADRYHARALRTPREVRNALAYVLLNARRHLAKNLGRSALARTPERLDPASSSRWFDGWKSTAPCARCFETPRTLDPPPVAAPHTWLLRTGWRRRGPLSFSEIPGSSS